MNTNQFFSITHRPSRGISRGALFSIVPAGSDKRTTVQPSKPKSTSKIALGKKGLRVCTFNIDIDNGAPESLARELSRLDISIAGLQEVRFPGQGEMSIDGYQIFWSGRSDGKKQEGVALCINRTLRATLKEWRPINEKLLFAKFGHTRRNLTILVCYAPT